jgi:hypothetical protein
MRKGFIVNINDFFLKNSRFRQIAQNSVKKLAKFNFLKRDIDPPIKVSDFLLIGEGTAVAPRDLPGAWALPRG